MTSKGTLIVQDIIVAFTRVAQDDFIFLTDIAKAKKRQKPRMSSKTGCARAQPSSSWAYGEKVTNNPQFKGGEFDHFKIEAGGALKLGKHQC